MSQNQTIPPVFVAGSGRSGTTWIGDIISSCSGCIPVFEPLHRKVPQVPRWGVNSGLPGAYLRPGESYPQWEAFFDALFAGRISNCWTRQDWVSVPKALGRWRLAERIGFRIAKIQFQSRHMRGNRYVIKEIRANLMLDWLTSRTDARIVYVIRHPCAVIASRMSRIQQEELDWVVDLDEILCQTSLMRDYLEPFRKTMREGSTPLRRQAILWCVENLVPLLQARSRDWLLFCYEEFVSDQNEAFKRVFQSLGLEPTSRTEWTKNRVVSNPTHDLSTPRPWYAPLTEAEGEEVLRVCEEFGVTLYGRQNSPLCLLDKFVNRGCASPGPPAAQWETRDMQEAQKR
jgi:Sulfotransferase family